MLRQLIQALPTAATPNASDVTSQPDRIARPRCCIQFTCHSKRGASMGGSADLYAEVDHAGVAVAARDRLQRQSALLDRRQAVVDPVGAVEGIARPLRLYGDCACTTSVGD